MQDVHTSLFHQRSTTDLNSATLTDGDGNAQHFSVGDTVLVPKEAVCGWTSTETVRKFYCIFLEKEATAEANAAE